MFGITFDTWDFFDSIPHDNLLSDLTFAVDAEFCQNKDFAAKYSRCDCRGLNIRNVLPRNLNRIILESPFKLQTDYLESLAKQTENFTNLGVRKVMFDFDLPSVFKDKDLSMSLQKILAPIKGIMYEAKIETELHFRLPGPDIAEFSKLAAEFRQKSMSGMNYSIDLHIHEAGGAKDSLIDELDPILFDIGTLNFVYDAALGNKLNPQLVKNIIGSLNNYTCRCDYCLCPSGNIDFRYIQTDLQQWLSILHDCKSN